MSGELHGGMGWLSDPKCPLRLSPEQRVLAEREAARERRDEERAAADAAEAAESRLASVAAKQDRDDAAAAAKQHIADCGCGECQERLAGSGQDRDEAAPRLNRWEIEREQREREAAKTPTDLRIDGVESKLEKAVDFVTGMVRKLI